MSYSSHGLLWENRRVMAEEATSNQTEIERLQGTVENLGLQKIQRHVFLCADQTKPKCCSYEEGLASWNYLKRRLKELGLDQPTGEPSCLVFRTKANCLRVCGCGPILLIYPEGVWYQKATPDAIERIIQDHLINNKIVEENLFLAHSLPVSEIRKGES